MTMGTRQVERTKHGPPPVPLQCQQGDVVSPVVCCPRHLQFRVCVCVYVPTVW